MAVKHDSTRESFDSWFEDIISDFRSELDGYDGIGFEEEVAGETYYILQS